jgi:hypothetical protein
MSPPGLKACPARPGGSTIEPEALIRDLYRLIDHHNIAIGPRKVNRLVREFIARIAKWTVRGSVEELLGDFLEHKLNLSIEQRQRITTDPDWARVIFYLDPTGEAACNRVLRQQGH